jgi:hypothetical protein
MKNSHKVKFLLGNIGTDSNHLLLTNFPRDKDIAKLEIDATIILLKEIYKNNSS